MVNMVSEMTGQSTKELLIRKIEHKRERIKQLAQFREDLEKKYNNGRLNVSINLAMNGHLKQILKYEKQLRELDV